MLTESLTNDYDFWVTLWKISIKEVIHIPHVDGGDEGEPDEEVSDVLSHQLVHSPFYQLLIDLWVVQHLQIVYISSTVSWSGRAICLSSRVWRPVPGNSSFVLMVSEPESKKFGTEKSLGTGIEKIWYQKRVSEPVSKNFGTEKESWNRSRKILVPVPKFFRILVLI